MTIFALPFGILIGAIAVALWTEHRVIEATRLRDNAITSRDAYRNILAARDDAPAKPEPAPAPFVPVNRIAHHFKD